MCKYALAQLVKHSPSIQRVSSLNIEHVTTNIQNYQKGLNLYYTFI